MSIYISEDQTPPIDPTYITPTVGKYVILIFLALISQYC